MAARAGNNESFLAGGSAGWWRYSTRQNGDSPAETPRVLSVRTKLQWATQICEALEYLVLPLTALIATHSIHSHSQHSLPLTALKGAARHASVRPPRGYA